MGLGKTVQAILSLKILMYAGAVKRALVICPSSLKTNWVREFGKWASDLHVVMIEGNRHQRSACFNRPAHVYITNFEKFSSRDEEKNDLGLVRDRPFDLVIIDEAQKIKNPGSQMAQNVKKLPRSYSWALTGTPLENRVEDLISVFGFVKHGLLKEFDAQRPFSQIKQIIAPYFLRRKKSEVLRQLPPKRYEEQWVELSDEQRSAYLLAEQRGVRNLKELGQQITIQHVFALIIHLKQICNFEVRSGASCKAELLQDELEEIILSGDKAIIFSQFRETIDYLQTRLGKGEVKYQTVCLHGEMSLSQRDSAIMNFKGDGFPVFLITTKAGGVGLNLAEASYVYHFDRLWNPAAERQAEDRAHRIGQTKSLLVTSIMAKDTIEERICQVLKRKQKLFDELIDSDYGAYERALSPEDAFEVLGLDKALAQVALKKRASG
jgi:SNF2 family DNA or RNA helicase